MTGKQELTGLALMRKVFPENQISKLPKATKAQTEECKADRSKGFRCPECGQWHHKNAVHLDYVGHAALTDRLLECDINWNWEPVAYAADGSPAFDRSGGMWIRLTVCGQTRLGYGHAEGKQGGDAIKEVIGDALRNAAMRFGAALDLWHKGDLHCDDASEQEAPKTQAKPQPQKALAKTGGNPFDDEPDTSEKTASVEHWRGMVNQMNSAREINDALKQSAHDKELSTIVHKRAKFIGLRPNEAMKCYEDK